MEHGVERRLLCDHKGVVGELERSAVAAHHGRRSGCGTHEAERVVAQEVALRVPGRGIPLRPRRESRRFLGDVGGESRQEPARVCPEAWCHQPGCPLGELSSSYAMPVATAYTAWWKRSIAISCLGQKTAGGATSSAGSAIWALPQTAAPWAAVAL